MKSVNLAKIYITYWKHMEIENVVICYFKFSSLLVMAVLQMHFALCSKDNVWDKCYVRGIISSVAVLLQYEKFFIICWGTLDLPKHAQLINLSMAQTCITTPTYSHHCTDHFTSLHEQTTSRNTLRHSLSVHTTTSYGNTNIQWKSGFAHDLVSIDSFHQWIWTKFTLHIENVWKL